jgi:hypothetical protein
MPIIESKIAAELLQLYNDLATIQKSPPAARAKLAKGHAKIIAKAIRSATVTIGPGIVVATTSGAGSTTSTGTGNLA